MRERNPRPASSLLLSSAHGKTRQENRSNPFSSWSCRIIWATRQRSSWALAFATVSEWLSSFTKHSSSRLLGFPETCSAHVSAPGTTSNTLSLSWCNVGCGCYLQAAHGFLHTRPNGIFPWCRAREKQKGEGKHMFQEATCKITMELCAGERNCHLHLAPEVWSCRRRTAREKRGTSRQLRKKHPHEQQNCWAMLTLPPRFSRSLGKEQFPDKPASINKCHSAGLRWKVPHCSEYAKKAELLEVDC